METIKRGDIYYADLSPVVGSEQGGTRPVIVLQNNTGNRFSPTIIVAPFTSNKGKKDVANTSFDEKRRNGIAEGFHRPARTGEINR